MNQIIKIENIIKNYYVGTVVVKALRSISLNIEENEYVAIMGPSGSGKSTLMNLLGCLDTPTEGSYILNGNDVSKMEDNELAEIRNSEIGFIFQTFNLLPRYNALENVTLPLIYAGKSKSERIERAKEVLANVGLADRMDHKPNELSGGQRQRVAVARALVNKPSIILADEPTGNLDSSHGEEVMDLLSELNNNGTSVIIVTHSLRDAEYGQRIIRLFDGQIINEDIRAKKVSTENEL